VARKELWEQVDSDLYQVLGVEHDATEEQIGDAWRSVAKRTHPDRGGSVAEFQAAEVAYQVLSDPFQRRRYDRAMLPPANAGDSGIVWGSAAAGRSGGFEWVRTNSWQDDSADVGFVPQFEYDYRDPGPVRPINPWLVALWVLLAVIGIVLFFVFLAGFSLLLIILLAATAAGRWLKSAAGGRR